MPRKPTGNPTGRPKGSGRLGEVVRLTVRIPTELYDRLEAFAEGRSYTRGNPELSGCVRALLEHALVCPYKRQTKNIPMPSSDNNSQPESEPASARDEIQQTINRAEPRSDSNRLAFNRTMASVPVEAQQEILAWWHAQQLKQQAEPAVALEETAVVASDVATMTPQVLEESGDDMQQTEMPPFDASKYVLGKLCPRAHDYHGTGKSLLRASNRHCLACDREKFHERKQAKRQAQPA